MEKVLSFLQNLPEYEALLKALRASKTAAVTGIGQINRSHLIAALSRDMGRPMVLICQDDIAAKRLQEELRAFLGTEVPSLPTRELTLYDSSAVSRSWEQKRLRQLYDLRRGAVPLQIMTWEALSLRTVPPEVLENAAFSLEVGKT